MRSLLTCALLAVAIHGSYAIAEEQKSYSGATASYAGAGTDGEWTSPARDLANTRYSPLTQINKDNVKSLKVAWTFSDGTQYGHEGAPLVVGNTMYLVTPFPNIAYALDLTKPSPSIKWTYAPNSSPEAIGKACCDAVLRGWSVADGKLVYNVLDDESVAVDTATGKELWRAKMDDPS